MSLGDSSKSRYPRLLWLIVVCVFLLSFVQALRHSPLSTAELQNDRATYHLLAVGMLKRHTYDSMAWWPPGYPGFLMVIHAIAGVENLWAVYLVQSLMLAASLVVLYRICLYVTENSCVSLLTVALTGAWPAVRGAAGDIMSEGLAGALVMALVWCLLAAVRRATWANCVAVGVLSALLALTKAVVLPFVVVAAIFVVLAGKDRRRRVGLGGVVVVTAAIALLPAMIHGYRVTGRVGMMCRGSGFNFWMGNWPEGQWQATKWGVFPPEIDRLVRGKTIPQQDSILMREGLRYITEDPGRAMVVFARKFGYLWLGSLGADPRARNSRAPHIGHYCVPKSSLVPTVVFVVSVAGWFLMPSASRKRAYPILALLITWTVCYVLVMAQHRYAIPVLPLELLFFSAGVCAIGARMLGRGNGGSDIAASQ